MNDCAEALVGFVGSHGDAFKLFEFAEEILDQMTPFVHLVVDRKRLGSPRMLGDDDLGAALVEIGDDGVAVESLVGDQGVKGEAVDEWFDADRIVPLTRQQNEAHEIAESVGKVVMPPLERPMAWL